MKGPNPYGTRRPVVRAAPGSPRLLTDCPRCGAFTGNRCWKLTSWVPHPDGGGFYTQRMDSFHTDRKAPRAERAVPANPNRTLLRDKIRKLSGRKLSGGDRLRTREWAGSTRRTEKELAQRVAELEAMADLSW
jgi:hypothetical protein